MAMTKKEREEFERMREERDLARALRWPEYGEPAMVKPPETSSSHHTSGWLFNPHRSRDEYSESSVYQAWSGSVTHGDGPAPRPDRSASQRGVHLYASRADALRALRLTLTLRFARILAAIDGEIEKEGGAGRPEN